MSSDERLLIDLSIEQAQDILADAPGAQALVRRLVADELRRRRIALEEEGLLVWVQERKCIMSTQPPLTYQDVITELSKHNVNTGPLILVDKHVDTNYLGNGWLIRLTFETRDRDTNEPLSVYSMLQVSPDWPIARLRREIETGIRNILELDRAWQRVRP